MRDDKIQEKSALPAYLRRKITGGHRIIVERTAHALRGVDHLKQIVASRLCALPHTTLQHVGATWRDFVQQPTHRVVVLAQNVVQLHVLVAGRPADALKVQHHLEHVGQIGGAYVGWTDPGGLHVGFICQFDRSMVWWYTFEPPLEQQLLTRSCSCCIW